jgi:signal transduction histidine kinase
MPEELHFVADAALIDRLGRELVGKQETALIELVKNAYDADALKVDVTFARDKLVINDNGSGMDRAELVEGFLRLASDMKVRHPLSEKYQRRRAGRKGIGRFSTQRLGRYLQLRTWKHEDRPGLQLTVNWNKFERGLALDEISVRLDEVDARHPGTEIEITHLRDSWSESQIRRCWRGVQNLLQPFPVAPVANKPKADPGFEVEFGQVEGVFGDRQVVANFETEIFDHLHAVVEFRVDAYGVAEWRISSNKFGSTTSWQTINHANRDTKAPPPYEHLRNAWLKAYYAVLDPTEFSALVFPRVREFLTAEGGIRLYRNDFRVVPYGEAGDDWLRLDEAYARRAHLFPIANRNWFGVIEVQDPEGTNFEEHTSREGLIETAAFAELRGLASSVLITAANTIAEQRGRKTRAGGDAEPTERYLRRLREATRKAREGTGSAAGGSGSASDDTLKLLGEAREVIEEVKAAFADKNSMLQLLATLGLTAAEFSHETGMAFQAVRLDLNRVFEVALAAKDSDNAFIETAHRAQSMLERLDALTAYLNELASARAARELACVSLSRTVEDFSKGMSQLAERSEVSLEVETPEFDALYTVPMHRAEVASILLNFYSNSIKAMKAARAERKIHVSAAREDDSVVLRFSDTGDGIAEENRERVFDLFFTTRPAAAAFVSGMDEAIGTGLGLWIVHEIVSRSKGTIEVVDPEPGFVTTIEVRLPAGEDEA